MRPEATALPSPNETDTASPILAQVLRGELVESVHRGRWVVVGEGGILHAGGDALAPMLPRSALKPLQLLPFFAAGGPRRLGLGPRERAVICASHSSDEGHIAAVRQVLARAGVPESALGCGAHAPIDQEAAQRLFRRLEEPGRIHNNCSGKHSGFLARAKELGATLHDYLDPAHPVQQEIRHVLHEMRGLDLRAEDAVFDGCGAPMYAFPLHELAAMFRDLANPEFLPRELQAGADEVFHAFVDEPHYIAGYREPHRLRIDTALLRAGHGRLFCKVGAEGVFAIGVRRGPDRPALGIAIKVDDGAGRGYEFFVPQLLRELGILTGREEELRQFWAAEISNTQGRSVGRVDVLVPRLRGGGTSRAETEEQRISR